MGEPSRWQTRAVPHLVVPLAAAPSRECSQTTDMKYTNLQTDLAHYEMQDIISKNKKRGLVPVYEKTAAVKYMTWDNDQWISYDETLRQKIEWTDGIGFAGSSR